MPKKANAGQWRIDETTVSCSWERACINEFFAVLVRPVWVGKFIFLIHTRKKHNFSQASRRRHLVVAESQSSVHVLAISGRARSSSSSSRLSTTRPASPRRKWQRRRWRKNSWLRGWNTDIGLYAHRYSRASYRRVYLGKHQYGANRHPRQGRRRNDAGSPQLQQRETASEASRSSAEKSTFFVDRSRTRWSNRSNCHDVPRKLN